MSSALLENGNFVTKDLFSHFPESSLIDFYKNNINKLSIIENDTTPIHLGFQHNKKQFINFLIDNNVNLNIKNSFGLTPVACAALNTELNSFTDKLLKSEVEFDNYDCFNNAISNSLLSNNTQFFNDIKSTKINYLGTFLDGRNLSHFIVNIVDINILNFLHEQKLDFSKVDNNGESLIKYKETKNNTVLFDFLKSLNLISDTPKKTKKMKNK